MFPDTELNDKLPPAKVFVIALLALNVVNAPVDGVVAPMAVEFRPVEVTVARVTEAVVKITLPANPSMPTSLTEPPETSWSPSPIYPLVPVDVPKD